jgi:hypothetical protein
MTIKHFLWCGNKKHPAFSRAQARATPKSRCKALSRGDNGGEERDHMGEGFENNRYLEPLAFYESTLQARAKEVTSDEFERLLALSGVDEAKNEQAFARYQEKCQETARAEASLSKAKGLQGFLVFLIVIFGLACFIGLVLSCLAYPDKLAYPFLYPIITVLAALAIVGLAFLLHRLNHGKLAERTKLAQGLEKEKNQQAGVLLAMVAPFKNRLSYGTELDIANTLIPFAHFHPSFSASAYAYMEKGCGLSAFDSGKDESVVDLLSGDLMKNPFLFLTKKEMALYDETYFGSLEISWTTQERDSNGNYYTEYHSEVLTASVSAPAPHYSYPLMLLYENEAAPRLSFSRQPSGLSRSWSPREYARLVKNRSRMLQKKAHEGVGEGSNYTALGNEDFEALFGGENRNNEVEFRLLFTPLAQKSLLALLTSREPYGDDFAFTKSGALNYLVENHFSDLGKGTIYAHELAPFLSVAELRDYYLEKTTTFFRALYFSLAPLFAIPLYTQKEGSFVEAERTESTLPQFSPFEEEMALNALPEEELAHKESSTTLILKSRLLDHGPHCDVIEAKSYSYKGKDRIAFVSVHGGDGYWHDVPVHWTEYEPLERTTYWVLGLVPPSANLASALAKTGYDKSFTSYHNGVLALKITQKAPLSEFEAFYDSLQKQNAQ